jgi:hypothetical protein
MAPGLPSWQVVPHDTASAAAYLAPQLADSSSCSITFADSDLRQQTTQRRFALQ